MNKEQPFIVSAIKGILTFNAVMICIFGTIFVIMGLISFHVPIKGMYMNKTEVTTPEQKVIWLIINLAMILAAVIYLRYTRKNKKEKPSILE